MDEFAFDVSESDKKTAAKLEAARDARRNSAGKVFTKRDCKDTRASEAVILSGLKTSKIEAAYHLLSSKPCTLMMKEHCKAYDEKMTVILDVYVDILDCMKLFTMPGVFKAEVLAIKERYRAADIKYDEFKADEASRLQKRMGMLLDITDINSALEMLNCLHKFRITSMNILADEMILDFITKKHFQHWRSQDHSSCNAVALQYYLYGDRSKTFGNVRPEGQPPEYHHTVHDAQNTIAHSTLLSMRTEDCYKLLKLDCHWLITLITGMERSPVSFSLHAATHTKMHDNGAKKVETKKSTGCLGLGGGSVQLKAHNDSAILDYPYVYANPAHERLLGAGQQPVDRGRLLGRSICDVIATEVTEPPIERKFGKDTSVTATDLSADTPLSPTLATVSEVLKWYPQMGDPTAEKGSLLGVTVESVLTAFLCRKRNNIVHAYMHAPLEPMPEGSSEKPHKPLTVPVVIGIQPLFDQTGTKVIYYACFHTEVPNDPFGATGAVSKTQVLLGQFPREIDTSNAGTSIRLPKNYHAGQRRNELSPINISKKAVNSMKSMLGVTPAISPMGSPKPMSPMGSPKPMSPVGSPKQISVKPKKTKGE